MLRKSVQRTVPGSEIRAGDYRRLSGRAVCFRWPGELRVGDEVDDGKLEAAAGSLDDSAGEPVRAALGLGRDDEQIGRDGVDGVGDRLERVGVSDPAGSVDTHLGELIGTFDESELGGAACLVVV
jgi:hypothetical protein